MLNTSKRKLKSTEEWKPIRGLEKYFSVSSHGQVRSVGRSYKTGGRMVERNKDSKILTQRKTRGYNYVVLDVKDGEFRFRRNIPVHRLVAQEFCDNRLSRKEVNHKDGNKLNNHFQNLEWVSRSENIKHAISLGLVTAPTPRRKFTDEQIIEVFNLRRQDLMHKEIAQRLGMGISTVTHILLGSRRKL
jgi:NUMOD4 motif/HNH endonuclease